MGQGSHGVFRLPQYIKRINSGGLITTPDIKAIEDRVAMALLDGDHGMVHLVITHATELAMSKAETTRIAGDGALHSNHARTAFLYAIMPVEKELQWER